MFKDTKSSIILLVEDSDDDAFFFGRALEKSGLKCSLHHVPDGAQAIDYLRNASRSDRDEMPQVIFLDLKMPHVNGFEVLEWMQAQAFRTAMQVIVLSGSEHQDDKDRAARLGASEYLVKPIKANDLQRFLHAICPREIGARV